MNFQGKGSQGCWLTIKQTPCNSTGVTYCPISLSMMPALQNTELSIEAFPQMFEYSIPVLERTCADREGVPRLSHCKRLFKSRQMADDSRECGKTRDKIITTR